MRQQQTFAKETPRKVNFAPEVTTPRVPGAMPASTVGEEKEVNVFDYLVPEHAPSSTEPMNIIDHAGNNSQGWNKENDGSFGFSYDSNPIKVSQEGTTSMEFKTPVSKDKKGRSQMKQSKNKQASSDKKRKRHADDDVDVDADTSGEAPCSTKNNVGTPVLRHSGLTGGLDRMLRDKNGGGRYRDGSSPIKRTRRSERETTTTKESYRDARRARAERLVSSMFGAPGSRYDAASKAMIRPNQKTRHQRDADGQSGHDQELQQSSHAYGQNDEVARYHAASHFLSLVIKGPESARGMSVHKVLKRLQAQNGNDDERDMWRALRVKRNERGEIVLFL